MNFKHYYFLLPLFVLLSTQLLGQTIADARVQAPGSTVTVRGIVTNGAELGKIRYLQDHTAGIAAFPGSGSVAGFDSTVLPGDSIEVTGNLVSFNGLLEITPITAYSIISSGNPLPPAKNIAFSTWSEDLESQLVQVNCAAFLSAGGVFNGSGSWTMVDPNGAQAKIYLATGHPLIGSSIPSEPVLLRGILSDYNGFRLLPRYSSDLDPAACFNFTQKPKQSNISSTGFQVDWETSISSECSLFIGTSPDPDQEYLVAGSTTTHSYVFSNLAPGTIYWVQAAAKQNGVTIYSVPVPFATQSLSSGQIKTYFNKGMDPAFANGNTADGETSQAVLAETIARIDAAQQSLDVAMYNNNRSDLTNALKAAHARGVQVRYLGSLGTSNLALNPPPPFPVFLGNEEAIMHNKFLVIDVDLPDQAWVMGGSMNWTSQNINTDFNNTLFIQDQSLARAYELEFEEMWGSGGLLPDSTNSRFGSAKYDNTPHQFIIGGYPVELYFSPSDGSTSQIESVIRSADSEALFAAFSFTKNELGNALVDMENATVPIRGIMENINDSGSEYNHLLANDVNVRHHNLTGEFHHKYAVVDAFDLSSDPMVVTGSHNWSNAAETVNDENLLVLHHPVLAALYKAEFEKRWGEFPPSRTIDPSDSNPFSVYPNPGSDFLELIHYTETEGVFWVKNTFGQLLQSVSSVPGQPARLNVSELKSGQYFITFVSAHVIATIPFQKI